MKLDWDQAEDIALALHEKFPTTDPLGLRFTELHRMVTGLDEFGGDPARSNEAKLEAIQMAWHEEYTDNR
jgi:FeS assembly protein IscX